MSFTMIKEDDRLPDQKAAQYKRSTADNSADRIVNLPDPSNPQAQRDHLVAKHAYHLEPDRGLSDRVGMNIHERTDNNSYQEHIGSTLRAVRKDPKYKNLSFAEQYDIATKLVDQAFIWEYAQELSPQALDETRKLITQAETAITAWVIAQLKEAKVPAERISQSLVEARVRALLEDCDGIRAIGAMKELAEKPRKFNTLERLTTFNGSQQNRLDRVVTLLKRDHKQK
jgi:hypothetical protein